MALVGNALARFTEQAGHEVVHQVAHRARGTLADRHPPEVRQEAEGALQHHRVEGRLVRVDLQVLKDLRRAPVQVEAQYLDAGLP